MGHCSCSRIAGLLELASKWSSSKHSVGGAIARMSAMIFCGLCLAGRPLGGEVLALGGLDDRSECNLEKGGHKCFFNVHFFTSQSTVVCGFHSKGTVLVNSVCC